ncbi:hypothetical protein BDZ91DRAFT_834898 [Kalaharituber pfeilii]|nr:hypothetical protein BDZ91DRAFT_834898 [Kalaharituber pfeilii]
MDSILGTIPVTLYALLKIYPYPQVHFTVGGLQGNLPFILELHACYPEALPSFAIIVTFNGRPGRCSIHNLCSDSNITPGNIARTFSQYKTNGTSPLQQLGSASRDAHGDEEPNAVSAGSADCNTAGMAILPRSSTNIPENSNPASVKFLHTDFFKIVLKDVVARSKLEAKTSPPDPNQTKPTDTEGGIPDEAVFYAHRSLLTSLSAELDKHVNNDMREGIQGVMELSEVDEATMTAFLQWAYKDDYTIENPKAASALLGHTKIYVFADRFNTVPLKDLAYNNITALLADLGMVAAADDVEAVMTAISYAFGNLPFSSFSSSCIAAPTERLLKYFAQYTSWALDVFRAKTEFCSLLEHSSDFAKALVTNSRSAATPPWSFTIVETGDGRNGTVSIESTRDDDKTHILSRLCTASGCNYAGVTDISTLGILGKDRVSGTKANFTYKCKWCTNSMPYKVPYAHEFMCCRKCGASGSKLKIQN